MSAEIRIVDWRPGVGDVETIELCYEHGAPLDANGICPVSGLKGRKRVSDEKIQPQI